MTVLYIILALLVVFFAVVLIRTASFRPKAEEPKSFEEVSFDREAAVNALASLVRCRTVSDSDASREDSAEFDKLTSMLPQLYPNVTKTCTQTRLPGRALLYLWKGKKFRRPCCTDGSL